jgi:HSP20 family protein
MVKFFGTGQKDDEENDILEEEEFDEYQGEEHDSGEYDVLGQIALDILENHEYVYILAPVAGIELSNIDISVHETTLTISGVRNKPREFLEEKFEIRSSECFWGKFRRSVILPENMDFSAIKAVMEDNLLVVSIPKIRFSSQSVKINKIYS